MIKIKLANLLLKERARVDALPNGSSFQITIVISQLAEKLGTTAYYVDKWIQEFIGDGLISYVRNNRGKNILKNGEWHNVYKYYNICTDSLNEFISEGVGYNGEMRKFVNFLKNHIYSYNSTTKQEIKSLLKWDEKKYQRRIKQLIREGVIRNYHKKQCPDKSFRYSFEYIGGHSEVLAGTKSSNGASVPKCTMHPGNTRSLDESIDNVIRLVKATGCDFSRSILDEKTRLDLEYVEANLKKNPIYRIDELKELSCQLAPSDEYPFRTSFTIVSFWKRKYVDNAKPLSTITEHPFCRTKKFWKKFLI